MATKKLTFKNTKERPDLYTPENLATMAVNKSTAEPLPEIEDNFLGTMNWDAAWNAVLQLLKGEVKWVLMYTSCPVLIGTERHVWGVVTDKNTDVRDPDWIFKSIYHGACIFFEARGAGVEATVYTEGDACRNEILTEFFSSQNIVVGLNPTDVVNAFATSDSYVNDMVYRSAKDVLEGKEEAVCVSIDPEEVKGTGRIVHHVKIFTPDSFSVNGHDYGNKLVQWSFSEGVTVGVVTKVEDARPEADREADEEDAETSAPADLGLTVEFVRNYHELSHSAFGKYVRCYSTTMDSLDHKVPYLDKRARPLTMKGYEYAKSEYSTDKILHVDALMVPSYQAPDNSAPLLRLRALHSDKVYYLSCMNGNAFQVSQTWDGKWSCGRSTVLGLANLLDARAAFGISCTSACRQGNASSGADYIHAIFKGLVYEALAKAATYTSCALEMGTVTEKLIDEYVDRVIDWVGENAGKRARKDAGTTIADIISRL